MTRVDYIISAIVIAIVIVVFTISPSPSPSNNPTIIKKIDIKENSKKPIDKKIEKNRRDIPVAHETYSSKINDKVKTKKSYIVDKKKHINNKVDKNIIDSADDDQELVARAIGKNEIKPLYKKWKKNGNELYNIYTTTPQKSDQSDSFAPPQIPSLVTIRVGNKPVSVAIPAKSEAYIVTKEDGEVKSRPIDSSNSEESLITPPAVGQ